MDNQKGDWMNISEMMHEYPIRMGCLIGFLISMTLSIFGVW